jgi:hypothetical protein
MYCGRCGYRESDSSLYCAKCGFDLHMGVRRTLLDERYDLSKKRHLPPSAHEDLVIRAVGVVLFGVLCFLISSQLMDTGGAPKSLTEPAILTSAALVLAGLVLLLIGWHGGTRRGACLSRIRMKAFLRRSFDPRAYSRSPRRTTSGLTLDCLYPHDHPYPVRSE